MSAILLIETATSVCSVGVSTTKGLVYRELNAPNIHATQLHVWIQDVLHEAGYTPTDLQAIAVSKGPGSYTGLRIGISAAKGLGYALDIPIIGINTLQSMANSLMQEPVVPPGALICPMIDARRMEVYAGIWNQDGTEARAIQADIVDEQTYIPYLDKGLVYFLGDGMPKLETLLSAHPNARFAHEKLPSVKWMLEPAQLAFEQQNWEDIAYFEPFYLKNFQAGIPKKIL